MKKKESKPVTPSAGDGIRRKGRQWKVPFLMPKVSFFCNNII